MQKIAKFQRVAILPILALMMAQLTACVTLLPEPKPTPSLFRFSHPAEANRNSILPDKVLLAVDEP